MDTMNKLKWISEHSKPSNQILIRTNIYETSFAPGYEWFVHYTYEFKDSTKESGIEHATVFREYTNDLDISLDKIIAIIESGNKEKYDVDTVHHINI